MKVDYKRALLLVSTIAFLASSEQLLAFSTGPAVRRTGSAIFNELSCTACHRDNAVNSGSGTLALTGVPSSYVLGQAYNLTVSIRQTGQSRWGFQLAARVRASVTQAGTLQLGSDGFTQLRADPTAVQFIEHTSAGTRQGTADDPVTFNFTWTAPTTNVGEVVFSVAANAANNNSANTGDFIYTQETISRPPDAPSVTATPSQTALIVPFAVESNAYRTNLGLTNLTSTAATVTVQFIDQSGGVVASKQYTSPPNGLFQVGGVIRDLMESQTTPNRQGYLLLETTQAIGAFSTPIDNTRLDAAVLQGTRGKAARLIVPTSTSIGLFRTGLIVINDGNVPNTVEIRFRDNGGTQRATRSITLAPYGFLQTEDVPGFLGLSDTFGPIEVRSTNTTPVNLIAVSRVFAPVTTANGTGTASAFFSEEVAP